MRLTFEWVLPDHPHALQSISHDAHSRAALTPALIEALQAVVSLEIISKKRPQVLVNTLNFLLLLLVILLLKSLMSVDSLLLNTVRLFF